MPPGGRGWFPRDGGFSEAVPGAEEDEAMLKSEEGFRVLVEASDDWVWEVNRDGVFTYCNPRVKDFLGYAVEEVVGKTPFDFMPPAEAKRVGAFLREGVDSGQPFSGYEHTCRHADGHLVVVEASGAPFFDGDGRLLGFRGINRDITDWKQAQAALRQAESRYRGLFEGSPLGILLADIETRAFLDANPAVCRMFGYTKSELLSLKLAHLHPADSLSAVESEFAAQARKEKELAPGLPCLRKDGTLFYADICSSPLHVHGHFCLVGFFSDITARQKAEEEREKLLKLQSQSNDALEEINGRLAESNRELENFAFVASHDLQAPLRKITAFGDRLMASYADSLEERGRDYVVRMQNAARCMQVLIDDLLAFSRVSSRAQPFEAVNLNAAAADVLSDLGGAIREAGASVDVGPLPLIEAEPTQMRQLFQNLVGNALKYRKSGEALWVRIRGRMLGGPAPGGDSGNGPCGEITVEDNGIGFDEQYAERIFGMFQRLHGRAAYEGTGIGLAICRKIVQRHKGTIQAESRPGEGSTFRVVLPVCQENSRFVADIPP